jgi:hypothetical protein
LVAAVFLVTAALLSGAWLVPKNGAIQESGSFSAPSLVQTARAQSSLPVIAAVYSGATTGSVIGTVSDGDDSAPLVYDGGMIEDPGLPFGSVTASAAVTSKNNTVAQAVSQTEEMPNFNSEFVMPTKGHNLGILHNYNAVDITSVCGTPVIAAADGLVVPDQNESNVAGNWNGGYGNFILLEHSFGDGVFTRYAHLAQSLVSIGSYVKQGQEIGLVGKTGDATGCHLHFEVIGAQNPFAKK